jgi:hypothetical protein
MKWNEIRDLHTRAVADFADAAERIPAAQWREPRAVGKWSPAELVEHLTLAYDVLQQELEGGPGMRIRTKPWLQVVLRWTIARRILGGGPFPKRSPAPRELRPALPEHGQDVAIAGFRERARRFASTTEALVGSGREVRLTHPYFGRAPLPESVLMCLRHVEHHRRQLA